ncbi:MAG TPA: metalloregulator ArsR/SmtB family transcription factor [Gemmatimonadaceae bacterium]|jgi:SAM-dependent methyltransferase|nr:metalloregulator ArsR/SmtB family transcription factor [Gemmatimonadaceae bacterium]
MTTIFDHLTALSDPTRSRLLLVLDRQELTVSELCMVLQLPQSTVSRHLKVLGDERWVISRADGTSRRYRIAVEELGGATKKLWTLVRDQVAASPAAQQDTQRLQGVLANRRTASQAFFSTSAGQWDRLRMELFGNRLDLIGLLGLLDESWTVGDLGCGTGQVSELLAPFVSDIIAVDESAAMLNAARKRLQPCGNVTVRHGDLAALPIEDQSLDVALLFLVLHYAADPDAIVREVTRVLKPDGRVLIVDMMTHDRDDLTQQMGHVWQGFSHEDVSRWVQHAGLGTLRYHPLPADSAAKGPTLFAASARRPAILASQYQDASLIHSA